MRPFEGTRGSKEETDGLTDRWRVGGRQKGASREREGGRGREGGREERTEEGRGRGRGRERGRRQAGRQAGRQGEGGRALEVLSHCHCGGRGRQGWRERERGGARA